MFNKPSGKMMVSGCKAEFFAGDGINRFFVKDTVNSGAVYLEGCSFDISCVNDTKLHDYRGTSIIDIAS